MGDTIIAGVNVTPLKIIPTVGGDVLRVLRNEEPSFVGFGEAYFSAVERDVIKGWKRHREMTLNLVVPVGAIRFVMHDDRETSATCGNYQSVTLSKRNYYRLTVPPMIWMGFQGCDDGLNLLLNIASISHDLEEADRKDLNEISVNWGEAQ